MSARGSLNGKKVLHLVNHDAMAARFLTPIFKWQISEGADVVVGCANWGKSEIVQSSGVRVTHIPFSLVPWKAARAFFTVRRLVTEGQFDIIHTHTTVAGWISRLALASVHRECDFHMLHGSFFDPGLCFWKRIIFTKIEQILSRRTHRYVVLNTFDRDALIDKGIAAPEDIFVTFGEGVDEKRIGQVSSTLGQQKKRSGSFTVGYLGRMIRKKGILELIRAADVLRKEYRQGVKVIFVGEFLSKSFLREARSLVAKLGLTNQVIFRGPTEDVNSFFGSIDVLVLPSHGEGEGFGMVIAEAAFAAIPVIVTDVPCFRDIVQDNRTGLITRRRNPGDLARAIFAMAENPTLRMRLAKNLYENRYNYSVEMVIDRIKVAYKTLLYKEWQD